MTRTKNKDSRLEFLVESFYDVKKRDLIAIFVNQLIRKHTVPLALVPSIVIN